MMGKRVLVTGPTGFIGFNLVKTLISEGHQVSALVRATSSVSKTEQLKRLGAIPIVADLQDKTSLSRAVAGQQVIFHLAAVTRALELETFKKVNLDGLANLLESVIADDSNAKFVFVSSLAAAGPSRRGKPHREDFLAEPISNYGKSKRDAENLASKFSDRLNISIVRPPIVLGPHDVKGSEMFKLIDRWGIHFTPGIRANDYSVIHVADLCSALMAVANNGRRMTQQDPDAGIYYAAADEIVSYQKLGTTISQALGRQTMLSFPIVHPMMRLIGGMNTVIGKLKGQPQFLNFDKTRDVTAGSWACENRKLKEETGFMLPFSLSDRMAQTVRWYRSAGWLEPISANSHQRSPETSHAGPASNGPTINVN